MDNLPFSIFSQRETPLLSAVFSKPFQKDIPAKINVEAFKANHTLKYKIMAVEHNKVLTSTVSLEELYEALARRIPLYGRWDMKTRDEEIHVLLNKKGNSRVIRKNLPPDEGQGKQFHYSHNRVKKYIIPEGSPCPFLQALGVMDKEGRVLADKQKKFRQINHFLEICREALAQVPSNGKLLDLGCGKSYLSFALDYYLNGVLGKNVAILGIDQKSDVIETCNAIAAQAGTGNLRFQPGDIRDLSPNTVADCVVSLHACDTATDHSIAAAVKMGAKVILAVPCCHKELYGQIVNAAMHPLLKHGILKERFAAHLTDALRAQILSMLGYKTEVMEFIDMEHTPKNIMIRAVKSKAPGKGHEEYAALRDMYGADPMLGRLLDQEMNKSGKGKSLEEFS